MEDHAGAPPAMAAAKFSDPLVTARGEARAFVDLKAARTLWVNTGTLCNIECVNCYIDSSPRNDALVYFGPQDLGDYLGQIRERGWPVEEIGFTGGEPFMNPDMIGMARMALAEGYRVLVLTNAMLPMMRRRTREGLVALQAEFGPRLRLRVSLDHWQAGRHDELRGKGSFAVTLRGMDWLAAQGFWMDVAGRSRWGESEAEARAGFAGLFASRGYDVPAQDPARLVIFPEMDVTAPVPEITTACWGILGKSPDAMMCASSRMVVRRRGSAGPVVVACTLLPYDPQFELGATLAEAEGPVRLNHPHCAKFCVLGGASCSV